MPEQVAKQVAIIDENDDFWEMIGYGCFYSYSVEALGNEGFVL